MYNPATNKQINELTVMKT